MVKVWIYIVCIGLLFFTAQAQQNTEIKLKLAQSYEKGRDYENAIKLYEEVYAADSTNYTVFDALKRNYLLTKRYPQAIVLMNRMLAQTPSDLGLMSELGTVYLRNADDSIAYAMWNRAIALDSTHEVTYSVVAGAMVDARVFDRAIEMYKRGRIACHNPKLFIPDLASLYANTLKYTEATEEYLKLIDDSPAQLAFVQMRISMYTKTEDGLKAATSAAELAAKSKPDNVIYPQLLGWMYMEGKRYDKAFDVFKVIDQNTNSGGNEIFNFAERAFHDKAYEAASKAYQEVIRVKPKFRMIAQTKFGYARTLEELSGTGDTLKLFGNVDPFQQPDKPVTESQPQYSAAVSEYKSIVKEYANTEVAANSLIRIAAIMYDHDFNLDEAQSTLDALIKNYVQFTPLIADGKFLLGDVYIAKGDIDKAEETFNSLMELRPLTQIVRENAELRLGEIMYFRGKWKEALDQLGSIVPDITSNTTNDALTLQIFIQGNQEKNSAELMQYAKADLLKRQRKLSEALAAYQEVFQKDTTADMADEALMSMGDVFAQMQRFNDAVGTYERMTTDFDESINLDKAMMKTARVYELGLHDKTKAIAAYEQLLEKFPNSIYVSEARKRVRELRGDNI